MQTKNRGYLPISRGLFEHPFWCEERCYSRFEAWLYLLKEARFEDTKLYLSNRVFIVKRGQISVSLRYLAQAWDWSTKRVKSYLELLKSDNMIVVEMPKETGQTLITICKYDCYNKTLPNEETARKQQGNSKETNINKDKVIINKENIPPNPLLGKSASSLNNFDSSLKNTPPPTTPTSPEEEKEKSCAKKEKPINYQLIVDIFHARCPSFPRVKRLTPKRIDRILPRVEQMERDTEKMYLVFDKMEASDFISGRTGRLIGSFDWIFNDLDKEDNWLKVYEGNYDNKDKPKTTAEIIQNEERARLIAKKKKDDKDKIAEQKSKKEEAQAMESAIKSFEEQGIAITQISSEVLQIEHNQHLISFKPYSETYFGPTIKGGRGLDELLELLKL